MAHKIQPAPDWRASGPELLAKYFDPDLGPEVRRAIEPLDSAKGYLHWDQFRFREAPDGWSAQELWALAKFQRAGSARQLPLLRQNNGLPFTLLNSGPMAAALHRIDTREVLWRSALGPAGSQFTDQSYQMMAAVEEAHHSSAIEGAVTTRRESRELIRKGRTPKSPSEQMVLNNYHALQRLSDWTESELTPELICEVQRIVTEDTLEDPRDQGVVRKDDDVQILDRTTGELVYQPPPAKELSKRLKDLCQFANETPRDEDFLSPVTRAILIHHQLAYDHPFGDGNGRTARTLFMWSMLRSGYPWLRAISISRAIHLSKAQYYRSYQYVQLDEGDVTYFVRYQLRCLEQEIERLAGFLDHRRQVAEWIRDRKALELELNTRQLALVDYAFDRLDAVFTAREHCEFHGVTQPTAWKDLTQLRDQGLLTEERVGRKALFRASRKLKRLSKERPK